MSAQIPDFVIIGAQKSASTFLQICLAEHPGIFLPHGETPVFESPDYEKNGTQVFASLFEGRTEKCLGIKRPNYLGRPEVPERIGRHLPDAKLIAVLRNPVDRAISAYFHNIKYGFLPPLPCEKGMRELLFNPQFLAEYPRSHEIIEFGLYFKYLCQYEDYLQRGQLLVFLHEEIVEHPLQCIQRAYEFLGVDQRFKPESLTTRPQKVVYNLTRLRFLRLMNRLMYIYNSDRTRLSIKKMTLLEKTAAGIIKGFDKLLLEPFFDNSKPVITGELRHEIFAKYNKDIASLQVLINRDLGDWQRV